MSKYPLPNTTLPKTDSRPGNDAGLFNDAAANDVQLLPPARPPEQSEQSASLPRRAAKGVYTMLKRRLRSSYLLSSAVHNARKDAASTGEQGYLLLHYFHSIK